MHRFVSTALVTLSLSAGILLADDWVTGVGGRPDRSSLSAEKGPWSANLLWSGSGNANFGEQVLTEGTRAFVARSGDNLIYAHDISTGRELWRKSLPSGPYINELVGVRDGQLYATRSFGTSNPDYLYALDTVDGSILWRSAALFDQLAEDGLSFSAEGDPIIGNYSSVVRVDRGTGNTVWSKPRTCAGPGACNVAVSGSRIYASENVSGSLLVQVYDVSTGAKLYASAPLTTGYTFCMPFVGGGRVFAPMTQGNQSDALVALLDNGSSLAELWRSALPNMSFASFGIGPDGSIYTYSPAHEILRIDPATGSIRNRSTAFPSDQQFTARLAIDPNGTVFATSDSLVGGGHLYAFDNALAPRWSVAFPHVSNSGPALGSGGTLLASGASQDVRAYTQSPVSVAAFRVDTRAGTGSNANGVLEPGETVSIEPSWRNILTFPVNMSGLIGFTGPAGATYASVDSFATYGFVATGATANCFDATGDCYKVSVSNPATRPAAHWDATFSEYVSGNSRTTPIHIGKSFADVPTTSPQYKFVETIFHNNITGGCTTGNFCPNDNVSRAQMAVFLLASKHGPTWTPPPAKGTVFTDVPANSFAAAWIERMPLEGISTGCGVGIYCPTANTTRAQMSVFLLRAQGGMSYNPPACTVAPFTDVPCSSPYAAWIAELVRRNIAGGCGNGKYCPDDPVTRGQMAVFLTTTFGLQLYAP